MSGEENGYPLQYSCLEKSHGQRSLVGYSPWGSQRLRHDWATFTLEWKQFIYVKIYILLLHTNLCVDFWFFILAVLKSLRVHVNEGLYLFFIPPEDQWVQITKKGLHFYKWVNLGFTFHGQLFLPNLFGSVTNLYYSHSKHRQYLGFLSFFFFLFFVFFWQK